jgi:hypothetical protein
VKAVIFSQSLWPACEVSAGAMARFLLRSRAQEPPGQKRRERYDDFGHRAIIDKLFASFLTVCQSRVRSTLALPFRRKTLYRARSWYFANL